MENLNYFEEKWRLYKACRDPKLVIDLYINGPKEKQPMILEYERRILLDYKKNDLLLKLPEPSTDTINQKILILELETSV